MTILNKGDYIKDLRISSNKTQPDFCKEICSPIFLSRIENNQKSISSQTFVSLCKKNNHSIYPSNLDISKLLKQTRLNSGISQKKLCTGLCSRSTLSKIENQMIDPSPLLLEALLERSGYYDTITPLWGNKTEMNISIIKNKILNETISADNHIDAFNPSDLYDIKFHSQVIRAYDAIVHRPFDDELLLNALKITQPHIDIYNFSNMYLTQLELFLLIKHIEVLIHQHQITTIDTEIHEICKYFKTNEYARKYSSMFPKFVSIYLQYINS